MTAVRPARRLPAAVFALGWVSLCTDLASEMIVPLLPVFLAGLGGTGRDLGLLQGASDLVVSLLKAASGWLSDRQQKRKPWILFGYGISAVLRPLFALVGTPWQAVAVRVGDRVGKGLRSAPRDALLADVVAAEDRGAAYGVQRSMDHAGALGGSLIAFALLLCGVGERTIFALAAIPGALALAVLWFGLREPERPAAPPRRSGSGIGELRALRPFLVVVVLSGATASVDLFLLKRALELGYEAPYLPLMWAWLHLIRAGLAAPLGALSDRVGRRRVIACGLGVQFAVLIAFGLLTPESAWAVWPLLAVHGLHAGFTEGAERGYVADLTGAGRRGTVFGVYHAVHGVAAFAGPVAMGMLWDASGPLVAFHVIAGLSVLALLMLLWAVPSSRGR
ncbi:MAG: MFS transporter [Planctomycetes bacterium]|nr:MFS transporter [Planctomycetota bacterium]